jgi:hypothetical protein
MLATTAKYANYGMNPLWPTTDVRYWNYQNTPAFLLAILAALDRFTRRKVQLSALANRQIRTDRSCLPAAAGLGGLFFAFHAFASDAGTLIAWSSEGYPIRGPTVFHGFMSLSAMAVGLLLSFSTNMAGSPAWWAVGLPGLGVLYGSKHWQSYAGGLLFLTFAFSVAPRLIGSALQHPPGRTFFLAWLFYDLLALLSIFCTAYAFVVRHQAVMCYGAYEVGSPMGTS